MQDSVLPRTPTPDLVIAGAARSGTSFLAAQLGAHPRIDPGSIKESNFFSRSYGKGNDWYEGLFQTREPDVVRMDASVSYTYPQYPQALSLLAAAAPDAYLVYVVRDPVARAVSHYLYNHHYFNQESAADFGTALTTNDLYVGASDYRRWLDDIYTVYPKEQVLVVPFHAVTAPGTEVADQICKALGLPMLPGPSAGAAAHQNNVVVFRHPGLRFVSRRLRRSRLYPLVRARLGASRLRRMRSLVTKHTALPTIEEALSTCRPEQLRELKDLELRSHAAVCAAVQDQDARTGLSWASLWTTPHSLAHRVADPG